MANIYFFLRHPNSKGPTPIVLRSIMNKQTFKFATGEKIHPKKWNQETQRARKNFTGGVELNDYLNTVQETLNRIYLNLSSLKADINPVILRELLNKELNRKTLVPKGFFEILAEYKEIKKGMLTPNYLKKVTTLENHLTEFQTDKKYKVTFERIDLLFYDKFISYLMTDKNQLNNTIGTNISVLKTFLIWATGRGHNANMKFKDREFKAVKQDGDIIYLTESELMNLFEMDLSGKTKLLKVRESFCFACFTGLRFSDISKIGKDNIKNDEINLMSSKTKTALKIPLNSFAKEILERNDYVLPVISNQKTNDFLKELGELAKIKEPVIVTKYRGVNVVETREPKYNCITTHTARRTFVTLSLEKGMRAETVMEITGHKSYKMFKKYIKITDKIKRIEMNQVWKREIPMQKVV